ncbi:MAG: hypothetical protein U0W24_08585 [Bacteroidales bacterium]
MDKTIFYSWQSDLPNNKNRGFIEECIEKSVSLIQSEKLNLEVAVDRDTKGVTGTPDIASTIFSKIDNSNIFIADISIVNPDSTKRKTPNPNVLIELGYAAKTLGWCNIICIFNTEFGKIEELPFDLKFRRPILYKIINSKNKTADRKILIDRIKNELIAILEQETKKDEIKIYIKKQIDNQINRICNHLFKIFYGYSNIYSLQSIHDMLKLTLIDIQKILFERNYIGFTVFKEWKGYIEKLKETLKHPFFIQNQEPNYINAIIKIVKSLETLVMFGNDDDLFYNTGEKAKDYVVCPDNIINQDNSKDGCLLLKRDISSQKPQIIDFGIIRRYKIQDVLSLHKINNGKLIDYTNGINETLKSIEDWKRKTGNNFILDPLEFNTPQH